MSVDETCRIHCQRTGHSAGAAARGAGVIRYDQRLGLSGEFRDRSFYNRPYSYTQFSVMRTYRIALAALDSTPIFYRS